MKNISPLFFVLFLSACAIQPEPSNDPDSEDDTVTTSFTLPKEHFDAKRRNVGNNSLSDFDILWAQMQGVPIPTIGADKNILIAYLEQQGFSIVYANDTEIVVTGRTKHITKEGVEIEFEQASEFSYTFEGNRLISGPNLKQ